MSINPELFDDHMSQMDQNRLAQSYEALLKDCRNKMAPDPKLYTATQRNLFVCDCGDVSHQFVITSFDDEGDMVIEVHLQRGSFWERLKNGLRYIFGKPSIYGDFDEVILNPVDQIRLRDILIEKISDNMK